MKARTRALVRALPVRIAMPLLAAVGTLEWLRPHHRAAAMARMRLLLRGTAREAEVRRLARLAVRRRRGLAELLWRYEVSVGAEIEGAETLAALTATGEGVLVAHTHACWIAPPMWALAAQGFADAIVLIVDDPPAPVQLHWQRMLTQWGVDTVPAGGSFERILARLRAGQVCHIALDVPGGTECVFLDKPARLASGIAALAFASGAAVVPVTAEHPGPGLRVRLGEPLRAASFADPAALTSHLAALASADILAAPELYHEHEWIERLWAPLD